MARAFLIAKGNHPYLDYIEPVAVFWFSTILSSGVGTYFASRRRCVDDAAAGNRKPPHLPHRRRAVAAPRRIYVEYHPSSVIQKQGKKPEFCIWELLPDFFVYFNVWVFRIYLKVCSTLGIIYFYVKRWSSWSRAKYVWGPYKYKDASLWNISLKYNIEIQDGG